jgi:hypothetical protein
MLFPIKPLRGRSSDGNEADAAFFNERMLLRRCRSALLQPSSLTGYGGEKRGRKPAVLCSGGGMGTYSSTDLIHADIIFSSAILCRYGGKISTSIEEAIRTTVDGAQRLVSAKWCIPSGLETAIGIAGREPTSTSLLFHGSNA